MLQLHTSTPDRDQVVETMITLTHLSATTAPSSQAGTAANCALRCAGAVWS
jgi:hypothetical protein